jgi:hypothetical protein
MTPLEAIVWSFAAVGWMLDWASTVWPNKELPESNPFVIRHFGRFPDPLRFGVAKVTSLVAFYVLYLVAEFLIQAVEWVPDHLYRVPTVLLAPLLVGIVGWYAFFHNFRRHLETRTKSNSESME